VGVDSWLRSLCPGGSTALAARLDAGDLRPDVAGGVVGFDDAIGASATQQGGVVDGVPGKSAALGAVTVR